MTAYGSDLAFIHDTGFGPLALSGGQRLIEALHRRGLREGTVVDIGCGGGLTSRLLTDAGFAVVGVDLSEAHIERARRRVPEGTFQVGSFVDLEIPPCVAVCAIGEVLGYGFDDRGGPAARRALFQRVFNSLARGGVFLFDLAGPDRAPAGPTRSFAEGEGWAVLVETSSEGDVLSRRIVTFQKTEGDLYRRDSEVHRLHLLPPAEVVADLRSIGFGVEEMDRYGGLTLPPGLHGFLAKKGS